MQWFALDEELSAIGGPSPFDSNARYSDEILFLHAIAGCVMELLGRLFWLGLAALFVQAEFFG
jgi:hypothetical protein